MKYTLTLFGLLISIALLISSDLAQAYMATFVRLQCEQFTTPQLSVKLTSTRLSDEQAYVFDQYARISKIRLKNIGGHRINKCYAFRFPEGLSVSVSADGETCVIGGVPTSPQALREAYVVASNQKGSSLAVVPVAVNAIVLRE